MCVHESVKTSVFQELNQKMQSNYGLLALTLVGKTDRHDFTMYVRKGQVRSIRRAAHDLRSWHPAVRGAMSVSYGRHQAVGFSDQSGERILGYGCSGGDLDELKPISNRKVPDSLDFDESNPESVYRRCLENGYVHDSVVDTVKELAARGWFNVTNLEWVKSEGFEVAEVLGRIHIKTHVGGNDAAVILDPNGQPSTVEPGSLAEQGLTTLDEAVQQKDAILAAPAKYSVWRHRKTSALYVVELVTNLQSNNAEKYPATVVYKRLDSDKIWSRRLDDWHRSFELFDETDTGDSFPTDLRTYVTQLSTSERAVAAKVLGILGNIVAEGEALAEDSEEPAEND